MKLGATLSSPNWRTELPELYQILKDSPKKVELLDSLWAEESSQETLKLKKLFRELEPLTIMANIAQSTKELIASIEMIFETLEKRQNEKALSPFLPVHGKSNILHFCAVNVESRVILENFIKKNKHLLNEKDESGSTPLHIAILKENLNMAQILIAEGANLDAYNNILITPLAAAVFTKNKAMVELLLDAGADPYARFSEGFQMNIVLLAKTEKGEDTPLSKYLEQRLSLDKDYLGRIAKEYRAMLYQQINIAKKAGKKVLVILGESHGHYKNEQIQKLMLKIAKELGIETAFAELPKNSSSIALTPAFHYAINTLGMKVVGVDDRLDGQKCKERSIMMAKRIKVIDQDSVLITGNHHLYDFIVDNSSQIDRNQFHIIPISMKGLLKDDRFEKMRFGPPKESEFFAMDPKKVIQIDSIGMSEHEEILNRLNGTPPKIVIVPAVVPAQSPKKELILTLDLLLPTLYEAIKGSPEQVKLFGSLRDEKETMDILKEFTPQQSHLLSITLNNKLDKFSSFPPAQRQAFLKIFLKRNAPALAKEPISPIKILLPILYEAIKSSPEQVKMFESLQDEKETIDILKGFTPQQCYQLSIILNGNLNKFIEFPAIQRQTFLKVFLKKYAAPIADPSVPPSSIGVDASISVPGVNPAPIVHAYSATKQPSVPASTPIVSNVGLQVAM